jgi:hypothetical protein
MPSQGKLTCAGLPKVMGGEVTLVRGVQPSVFRVRVVPTPNLPAFVGTVSLHYGSTRIDFADCATAPQVLRIYKGREPFTRSVLVYDRRWKWRYPRISGEYNSTLCDGSAQENKRASLQDLLIKLMDALGEGGVVYHDVPNVYPAVSWNNAYAARELEDLLEKAGLVVYLSLNGNAVIERLGSGDELPNLPKITPNIVYHQSVKPSKVRITGGQSTFQTKLDFSEAVGLDADGSIKPVDNLSYKPADGWANEWYTCFSGVAPEFRPLAFISVWRWYRLIGQAGGSLSIPGVDIPLTSIEQYKLLDKLAEEQADSLGIKRCMDAVVTGIFWPQSDLQFTTDESRYSGKFRIRPDLHILEFDYPVINLFGEISAAELYLTVAYNITDQQGGQVTDKYDKDVPGALVATAPRVEKRSYLKRVRNTNPIYTGSTDNDPTEEANAWLDNITATYADTQEIDHKYGGLVPIGLSGKIAQVRFRWGNGRVATTRASLNHEFDTATITHQERRRRERLGQLVDRVLDE